MNRWMPAFSRPRLAQIKIRGLGEASLGQNEVPPFGWRPVPTGLAMVGIGLLPAVFGGYYAFRYASSEKNLVNYLFKSPGGAALLVLALSSGFIALGTLEIAGGVLVKKLLDEYQTRPQSA